MKKNSFYVIEEKDEKTGKTYAHAETVPNNYNLVGKFAVPKGHVLLSVNACDTKKEANDIADFWNKQAREKNNYIYG